MRFEYRLSQPSNLIALSIAAIVVFFCVSYKADFDEDGIQSSESITSNTFQKYVMACLGGSIALCFSCAADCLGKYLLREQFELRSCQEFLLILTILLPSVCLMTNLEQNNAVAFFWPLFHIQIMVILNVTLVFWADKMGVSKSSPIVMLNSALSCATFTIHVFTPTPSWTTTTTSSSVSGVLYMLCFGAAMVTACYTVRLTYNKNTNKNAVVLINTAAAEQQWALLLSILIVSYYAAFLVLEAGVFPHNDRNNLQAGYISANYVLLSVFALCVLTLHQRRELYQGIISQASLEIKRVFVRYVSHEIRTPLNTTLLGLNLLGNEVRDGTADTEVLTELIQDATGSCTIAIGILNDLLMYEKIDGGLLTLERAETPVWSFVEDVLKVFLIQAKSSEVELVWPQRCIKGVYAEIDKYKLSQVMRNLVSNALKFTPAGGKVRVFAEVVLSGTKPANARALSVLNEVDECCEEDHSNGDVAAKTHTGNKKQRKSKKIATKAKPVAKSFDATKDDFASIHRSISQASEETPPHVYSVPPGFPHSPTHRNNTGNFDASNSMSNSLSGRDAAALFPGLVPEANSDRAIGDNRLAGLPMDIETGGDEDIHGEEGTTKTFCVSTPIAQQRQQQQQAGNKYAAVNAADLEQGLANTKVLQTSSPESSNDSTPQKDRDITLSERTFALAKKLFSGDQERSNLQVFPSVSMVRISVTDSGAGISKENQNRLFKEIVQFNAGKLQNGQGSGIGLWISNTIVKLHGGTIGVTSDGEGHGSTFYIDIPISKIEKGSNYSHTSPAHTDVSSKHKYNSPSCSPNCSPQSRGRSQSSPVKPTSLLASTFAVHDPLRAFISPDSTQSSVQKSAFSPQAQPHVSTHHSHHSHHSHTHKHTHPTNDHQRTAGAFVNPAGDIPLSDIGNSLVPHMPRTYSDQSIFTGGSNRSRGTMKSSFSTDEDGVSSKTDVDISESWKAAIGAVAGVGFGASSAKVTSLTVAQGQSIPNPFPNVPANLFPEHARKLSLSTTVAMSTAATLAAASGGASGGGVGSGKAPRLSIAEGQDEDCSPAAQIAVQNTYTSATVPLVPATSSVEAAKAAPATVSAPPRVTSSTTGAASNNHNHLLFDKRALIVDDSATNRKFVNRLLRTKIGTRDEAEDGQKAVEKVAQSMSAGAPYDVILMDYVMPVMDGPTATAKIRALGYKGVILGVTGNGHQPEIDLFMHSGANRILIKPLSADQFYDILLDSLQPASSV